MWAMLQREWVRRLTLLYGGRMDLVPSRDGDEGKQCPPTFNAHMELKKNGATEADLSEVDRILEHNKLFAPDRKIYWYTRTFLAL